MEVETEQVETKLPSEETKEEPMVNIQDNFTENKNEENLHLKNAEEIVH